MLKKLGRWPVFAAVAVLAAAGHFLRKGQLAAFDGAGLPSGSGVWGLAAVCVLALAICAAAAFTAGEGEDRKADYLTAVLSVGAALFLAAGSLAAFAAAASLPMRLTAVLGVLTGLCFAAAPWRREKKPAALWLLPIAYYILQMIFSFKRWGTDPIILDYCFKLFALIFTMLGAYFLGGFAFGEGKRRKSLFFTLGGVFFCAVALADGGTVHVLQTLGGMLYLAAGALGLMKE